MNNIEKLIKSEFEALEIKTVSDSFGAEKSRGDKAPVFTFNPIIDYLYENFETVNDNKFIEATVSLKEKVEENELKYIFQCTGRFAFCIELTNLQITSTKLKTRWMPGKILKLKPSTFTNVEGTFCPNKDPRSSSFIDCFDVFKCLIIMLSKSETHIDIMKQLSDKEKRAFKYESVYVYKDKTLDPIHKNTNIRLSVLNDIKWLIAARPIFYPLLSSGIENDLTLKIKNKIITKCYKTDRSQTGEDQTNRAKRWECLSTDFQGASLEDCWSVERKLLEDITGFTSFPKSHIDKLKKQKLIKIKSVECPITFQELSLKKLLSSHTHGQSDFQVGHLVPLKSNGLHKGSNIAWISDHGNRIQGNLTIEETHKMIMEIADKLSNQK